VNNIIIVGHEEFPSGLKQTGSLITGDKSSVIVCQLFSDESPEAYKDKLLMILKNNNNENIILCDLIGGTPFKVAMEIKQAEQKSNIQIITGINLPGLLTGILSKDNLEVIELVNEITQEAKNGIRIF